MPRKTQLSHNKVTQLEHIPNIGPSIAADLRRIGIQHPTDLAGKEPFALYTQLCEHDGQAHDLCVLDVFMAAVDFMGGTPSRPWWKYTPQRKREMAMRQQSKSSIAKKLGRRAVLVNGALALLATKTMQVSATPPHNPPEEKNLLRFSMLTDLHHADKPPGGTRFYRETLGKLTAARRSISEFQPQFVVELGDVIDAAETV